MEFLPLADVASADQQKPAGSQSKEEEEEDAGMELEEQLEDLQPGDSEELKPEKLESSRTSQKGTCRGSDRRWACRMNWVTGVRRSCVSRGGKRGSRSSETA